MKNSKKAQGLPLNTIVMAVIALLVLAILAVVFIGKIGGFGAAATDCSTKAPGADCKVSCNSNEYPVPGLCEDNQLCCIPKKTEE